MFLGDVINVTQAIYSWDDEKWDYDYETNTCKEGKVCGHYTQVYTLSAYTNYQNKWKDYTHYQSNRKITQKDYFSNISFFKSYHYRNFTKQNNENRRFECVTID